MAEKETVILLVLMMFSVNIGLTSLDMAGINIFGDSGSLGSGMSYEELMAGYQGLQPLGEACQNTTGLITGFLCLLEGTPLEFFSTAGQYAILFFKAIFVTVTFIVSNIQIILFGWYYAIMLIANAIEAGFGAIHVLLTIIPAMITIYVIWGVLEIFTGAK